MRPVPVCFVAELNIGQLTTTLVAAACPSAGLVVALAQ
jgi:hypothetical protein